LIGLAYGDPRHHLALTRGEKLTIGKILQDLRATFVFEPRANRSADPLDRCASSRMQTGVRPPSQTTGPRHRQSRSPRNRFRPTPSTASRAPTHPRRRHGRSPLGDDFLRDIRDQAKIAAITGCEIDRLGSSAMRASFAMLAPKIALLFASGLVGIYTGKLQKI